jgi:hypothetical protein
MTAGAPHEVEVRLSNRVGVIPDHVVPVLRAVVRELGVPVPIRFPVEPLQHHAVIVEPALHVDGQRGGERCEDNQQRSYEQL